MSAVSVSDLSDRFHSAYSSLQSNEARFAQLAKQRPDRTNKSQQLKNKFHQTLKEITQQQQQHDGDENDDACDNEINVSFQSLDDSEFSSSSAIDKLTAEQIEREANRAADAEQKSEDFLSQREIARETEIIRLTSMVRDQRIRWEMAQKLNGQQQKTENENSQYFNAARTPSKFHINNQTGNNSSQVNFPHPNLFSMSPSPMMIDTLDDLFRDEIHRIIRDHESILRSKELEWLQEKEIILKEIKKVCQERDREIQKFAEEKREWQKRLNEEINNYEQKLRKTREDNHRNNHSEDEINLLVTENNEIKLKSQQFQSQLAAAQEENYSIKNENLQLKNKTKEFESLIDKQEKELQHLQQARNGDIELFQSQIEQLAVFRKLTQNQQINKLTTKIQTQKTQANQQKQQSQSTIKTQSQQSTQRPLSITRTPQPNNYSIPPVVRSPSPSNPDSRHFSLQELAAMD